MLFLAEFDLEDLLPQLIFIGALVASALRSIFAAKKKENARPRRRRPQNVELPAEEELHFPVLVEELPESEPERAPQAQVPQTQLQTQAQAQHQSRSQLEPLFEGMPSAQARDASAPIGLDLDELDASLPSRHEEMFESHRRSSDVDEGKRDLPAIRRQAPPPKRTRHRITPKDRHAMRHAILMAEVLGRPVSLRKDSIAGDRY